MKNFQSLATVVCALICAGLLTACASHHHAKKSTTKPAATCTAKAPAACSDTNACTMKLTKPIVLTPAPVAPPTKEERLASLLQLYMTDKITPQEYHLQRADIIAQP